MATVEGALKMFDRQAAAAAAMDVAVQSVTAGFERLSAAIDGAANKLAGLVDSLQAAPQAAEKTGENFKAPFDNVVGNTVRMIEDGKLSNLIKNPQNILISLAVGVVWEVLGDDILTLLEPVFQVVAAAAEFLRGVFATLAPVLWLVQLVADGLTIVLGFLTEHMDVLAPIIWGVIAAMRVFNCSLLASPISWIIIGIIALISVIYAIVAAYNKFTGESVSAAGIICGAVMFAVAVIGNLVIGLINAMIQYLWSRFAEPFIGIIEWILNIVNGGFDGLGGAVANLIGQIISWFSSLAKIVTKIIDAMFGTGLTDGLSSLQDSVLAWGKNDNAITLEHKAPAFDRIEYGTAFDAGYSFGQGIEEKASGLFNFGGGEDDPLSLLMNPGEADLAGELPFLFDGQPEPGGLEAYGLSNSLGGIYDNTADTALSTAAMADSLECTEEDLKYWRDIAEREAINRFTTAEIHIDMGGVSNSISKDVDVDGVVDAMSRRLAEQIAVSAERMYL